jgi:acetamidase/formamidase
MAQRSNKSSLLASLSSLPTDNASVEAAWRQVLLSRDERIIARLRRAEAEAAKEAAENDYGMSQGEAYMFLSQCLEARVTQFVNPSYSYVAKVASKYLV